MLVLVKYSDISDKKKTLNVKLKGKIRLLIN